MVGREHGWMIYGCEWMHSLLRCDGRLSLCVYVCVWHLYSPAALRPTPPLSLCFSTWQRDPQNRRPHSGDRNASQRCLLTTRWEDERRATASLRACRVLRGDNRW